MPHQAPHPDDIASSIVHFNETFRHRYHLPPISLEQLLAAEGLKDELELLPTVRANGVADATCALIARAVLSLVPRYAIGFVDGRGRVSLQAPEEGEETAYRGRNVVLVNPLGGRDNWAAVSAWVRRHGGDQARRRELAGLATEDRPDDEANWELLAEAAATHGRAIALPPDEAFSQSRAAEVSYIYGVPVETLRAWKRTYRAELASPKVGRPKKKR